LETLLLLALLPIVFLIIFWLLEEFIYDEALKKIKDELPFKEFPVWIWGVLAVFAMYIWLV
jgi:uncharacterized membrane protein